MPKLLTEFVGTFFLVFTIVLAVPHAGNLAPVAIGLILMTMVYMGGHISGAHYNPAVTLAVLVRGRITVAEAIPYWVVQFVAAIVAALAGFYLNNAGLSAANADLVVTVAPSPGPSVPLIAAGLVEVLFTFALALVVLNVATAKETSGNSYFGAAIGLTVCAGAFAGGPISGGAFNPAVGTGPALVAAMFGKNGGAALAHIPLYLIAPGLGGLLAGIVFKLQHPND